ncbi:helix-turn-helix domain-containing protein [Kitasatospora sp. NA04385]|uniref:helix-turn-helix domain-containing protein n=1 Tax=Kitasatospora sp. NA04385 TaxID=2742135 RepID=UPI0015906A06|nr:helix-turn-helix domain-containing protein [Kitasatospora sp. NA04385]QKW21127.1 helix-turn-helix domain-containing protein [Kitasatospora sp. NA04385]
MGEDAWNGPELRAGTLERLLTLVGQMIEKTALPRPHAPARHLLVFDPYDPPGTDLADTVLVGVGVDPSSAAAEDLLVRAGGDRVTAVVLRGTGDRAREEHLRRVAERVGTTLLLRASWAEWHLVISTLRAAMEGPAADGGNVPLGDLGGLARQIARRVEGAVTIEDPDSRVLAHHAESADLDRIRLWTVLTGTVPEERRRAMDRDGFFKQLWSSPQVLHRLADGEVPERMAVAVQAGGMRLGSIWVAAITGKPLQKRAIGVLQAAAEAAVAHLLYHHAHHDARNALLLGAARAVLDGPGSGALLAGHSGLPADARCAVLAVGAPGRADEERRVLLEHGVRMHQRRPGDGYLVLPVERGVLVLVCGLAKDPAAARTQVADYGDSLAGYLSERLRTRVLIGLGPVQARLDDAARSRRAADLALGGLLFVREGPENGCATVEQVADAVALRHVIETVGELPLPVRTPVSRLAAAPAQDGHHPLDLLSAYLRHGQRKGPAADALGIPRATFDRRFTKLLETAGLDADSAHAMLLARIQLLVREFRAEHG